MSNSLYCTAQYVALVFGDGSFCHSAADKPAKPDITPATPEKRTAKPDKPDQPAKPDKPLKSRSRRAHQSKAPTSEFKVCKSSEIRIRGAPSVRRVSRVLSLRSAVPHQSTVPEFKVRKNSDFEISDAQSVQGSILEVQGL